MFLLQQHWSQHEWYSCYKCALQNAKMSYEKPSGSSERLFCGHTRLQQFSVCSGVQASAGRHAPTYRPAITVVKMSRHVSPPPFRSAHGIRCTGLGLMRLALTNKCHTASVMLRWLRNNRLILLCVWMRVWVCAVISWVDHGLFLSSVIVSAPRLYLLVLLNNDAVSVY